MTRRRRYGPSGFSTVGRAANLKRLARMNEDLRHKGMKKGGKQSSEAKRLKKVAVTLAKLDWLEQEDQPS
jgi:hypothetical protein